MFEVKYFQLGLPLGSCLLIIGLVELTHLFTFCGLDLAKILYFSYGITYENGVISGSMIALEVVGTIYKAGSTVLLWFAIFMGNKTLLLVWIFSAILFPLVYVITGVIYGLEGHLKWLNWGWTLAAIILITSYQVLIGRWSHKALSGGQILQPLGKGIAYMWEYLCSELNQAARFFIVAEMVLDSQYMLLRGIYLIFSDSDHPAILAENLIMTLIRLVMDVIGLYLVTKEYRRKVGMWCGTVGIQILISIGLFVIFSIATLTGEEGNVLDLIDVFLFFPVHLSFRSIVLYFSWRYSRHNLVAVIL